MAIAGLGMWAQERGGHNVVMGVLSYKWQGADKF